MPSPGDFLATRLAPMFRRWNLGTLILGLAVASTTPSFAEPANDKEHAAHAKKPAGGKDARRKQRMEKQAERLDKRAAELQAEGKTDEANRMKERAAKLRKASDVEPKRRGKPRSPEDARKQRKFQKLKGLKQKYGKSLDNPAVRDELSLHAERRAKLKRMKQVADEQGKQPVSERVSKLMGKEDERHAKEMAKLTGKGDAPAAASGAKEKAQ
jgi:hypothetical protein